MSADFTIDMIVGFIAKQKHTYQEYTFGFGFSIYLSQKMPSPPPPSLRCHHHRSVVVLVVVIIFVSLTVNLAIPYDIHGYTDIESKY